MESVCVFGGDPPANYQGEEVDCTTRDLEVLGAESIEAEGADDDRGKLKGDVSEAYGKQDYGPYSRLIKLNVHLSKPSWAPGHPQP